MANPHFLLTYIYACTAGRLGHAECGPVWQLGVIAILLTAAVAFLIVIRRHARA